MSSAEENMENLIIVKILHSFTFEWSKVFETLLKISFNLRQNFTEQVRIEEVYNVTFMKANRFSTFAGKKLHFSSIIQGF